MEDKDKPEELEIVPDHVANMVDLLERKNTVLIHSRSMGKTAAIAIMKAKRAELPLELEYFEKSDVCEGGSNIYVVGLLPQQQMWLALKNENGVALEKSLLDEVTKIRERDPTAIFRSVTKDWFDED